MGIIGICVRVTALLVLVMYSSTTGWGQSRLSSCPGQYLTIAHWHNCFGTVTFGDGSKYVGEFRDEKPHGQGTYTGANGAKYVGEFRYGNFHGQGTFTSANGDKYVGEFRDGKRNGQGTATFANGNKYVGEFRDGKFHGQGTGTFANGDKYVGEWRDDKRTELGTYTAQPSQNIPRYADTPVREARQPQKSDPLTQAIQVELIRIGALSGGADGIFGSQTYAAILQYQKMQNLPSDGRISDALLTALRSVTAVSGGSASGVLSTSSAVRLIKEGGTFKVPVLINGIIPLHFTVDSGASDVRIPSDVVLTLVRTGTITDGDFLGEQTYVLADGSRVKSKTFRIRSLKVGDKVVENVLGSVADVKGSLLLGQSFLSRFKKVSFDYSQGTLVLE